MKKYILLFLSVFTFIRCVAQSFTNAYFDSVSFYAFTDSSIFLKSSQGITKTDYLLNPIWQKHIPLLDSNQISIQILNDELYILKDSTIFKYDSSGNAVWTKTFSTKVCPWFDPAGLFRVFTVDKRRIYLSTVQLSPTNYWHQSQIVLDTAGNILNVYCDSAGHFRSLIQAKAIGSYSGGAWIARQQLNGNFYTINVLKVDSTGQVDLSANIISDGSVDYNLVNGLYALPDHNYFLLNESFIWPDHGWLDCVKFNDLGVIDWAKTIESPSQVATLHTAYGGFASADSAGNIYISYTYDDTGSAKKAITIFDRFGNQVYSIRANNFSAGQFRRGLPFYVHNTNFQNVYEGIHNGVIVADTTLNSNCYGNDTALIITTGAAFAFFGHGGQYPYQATFSSDSSLIPIPSSAFSLSLVPHTLCTTVGIIEPKRDDIVSIYPNPCNGRFTFSTKEEKSNALVQIYNALNEKLYESILHGNSQIINIDLESGIYFIRLVDDENTITNKIVVQ